MKIKPVIRNYIEHELYHYRDYVEELDRERERILEASPPPPDGLPSGNATGDTTAGKALALCQKSTAMLALERSVRAVENTMERLSPLHKEIFDYIYVKHKNESYAAYDRLYTSERTFKRYKYEIIRRMGAEMGIV